MRADDSVRFMSIPPELGDIARAVFGINATTAAVGSNGFVSFAADAAPLDPHPAISSSLTNAPGFAAAMWINLRSDDDMYAGVKQLVTQRVVLPNHNRPARWVVSWATYAAGFVAQSSRPGYASICLSPFFLPQRLLNARAAFAQTQVPDASLGYGRDRLPLQRHSAPV
jgi:hypothetical protein